MAPAKATEAFEPTARQEGAVEAKPKPRLKFINRQQQLLVVRYKVCKAG
jgi:hypothetical protein